MEIKKEVYYHSPKNYEYIRAKKREWTAAISRARKVIQKLIDDNIPVNVPVCNAPIWPK